MTDSPQTAFSPRRYGKYLLLERIGRGGMAEVFRAKNYGTAGFVKECAIKKILSSLMDDAQFVHMFVDEARITARLAHPNIVQVLDLGEIDGSLFISMEFVDGKDLLDLLARCARRGQKIPETAVLYIAQELLKGLDHAHHALDATGEPMRIVHRDVSPSNILLSYDGQVKVGDFGIAKSGVQRSQTESGTQKGKSGYMSPEQVVGGPIDRRSDLFAAAVILFEMLTMSRLFKAPNDLDVMLKIRDCTIADDLNRLSNYPEDLQAILRKGLARDPAKRFQTGREFSDALHEHCIKSGIRATAAELASVLAETFPDKIEEEVKRRKADPSPEQGYLEITKVDAPLWRYRAPDGIIHGPMKVGMLEELLESREAQAAEALSYDGGAWKKIADFSEFKNTRRRAVNPVAVESSDPYAPQFTATRLTDWEAQSLAGINPAHAENLRRRLQKKATIDNPETRFPGPDTSGASRRTASSAPSAESGAHARVRPESGGQAQARPDSGASPRYRPDSGANPRVGADSGAQFRTDSQSTPKYRTDAQPTRPVPVASTRTLVAEQGKKLPSSAPASASVHTAITTPNASISAEASRINRARSSIAPSITGNLGNCSSLRLIYRVHRSRLTGRLRISGPDAAKDLYFRNGEIIAVDSTLPTDRLGTLLLSRNLVNPQQLQEAEALDGSSEDALGGSLVRLRYCAPHEISHYFGELLREKILELLFWPTASWAWWGGFDFEAEMAHSRVFLLELLSRGVIERATTPYLRSFFRDRKDIPLVDVNRANSEVHLSARALRMRTAIRPDSTINSCIKTFADRYQWSDREVLQTIFLLTEFEIFRFRDEGEYLLPGG